ncbi:MarR family winged helix-turn-helix transcriptional regulator [Deinococcus carri]|uniref:MarR family winged helix-turn-helix transcriptional regulator n=1 Tax=Deinococcus carri TaxID=1211323 RepID=UPI0031EE936D
MAEVSSPTPQTERATPEVAFLTALWDAWQALTSRGEAELRARHDLDLRSLIALAYVQGGADQPAQLARELGVPRYEVSRVLHALETRGAVTRDQTQADARRVTVRVTPQGAALWEEALGTVRAVTGPALAALGPRAASLTHDLHLLAQFTRSQPTATSSFATPSSPAQESE